MLGRLETTAVMAGITTRGRDIDEGRRLRRKGNGDIGDWSSGAVGHLYSVVDGCWLLSCGVPNDDGESDAES
jgi:hypothetical protein